MAGTGVTLYATTAAGNKAVIGTIDWREDIYMPSQINDNLGQIMADIRALVNGIATGWVEFGDGEGTYTATYNTPTQFVIAGVDVATYYRPGFRVYVSGPITGQVVGTITAASFSTHTYVTVAWDAGALANETYTNVLIGVGSLAANAAAATALASVPTSYRNILGRNGGFEVWQRGAGGSAVFSITAGNGQYTADGWYATSGGNLLTVGQTSGETAGSRYALYVVRVNGQTSLSPIFLEFPLDTDEIVAARGQNVTLSFTMHVGANWSPASGFITAAFATGTGAPAKLSTGAYTGQTTVATTTFAPTTTAARYSVASSVVVPTNATQATVIFSWTPTGTAGAADSMAVDDVTLEIGTAATLFERRPFEQELAACRRHFWKTFPYETAPANNAGVTGSWLFLQTVAPLTAMGSPSLFFPTPMRVAPTMTGFNVSAFAAGQARNINVPQDCTATTLFPAYNQVYATVQTPAASAIGHQLLLHMCADAGI